MAKHKLWKPEKTNFLALHVYARKECEGVPLEEQPDFVSLGCFYTQLPPVVGQQLSVKLDEATLIPVMVEEVGYTAYTDVRDMEPLQVWGKVENSGGGATHADFDKACERYGIVELRDTMQPVPRYIQVRVVDFELVEQEAETGVLSSQERADQLIEAVLKD